jgi:DNA-binding transcriptional MerR regulator
MAHLSDDAAPPCKRKTGEPPRDCTSETGRLLSPREAPMTEERLSFKDMCAKFEVTPRTLRYYEYIELIAPEKEGRARWYGPREVARMTLILRGRRFGFSLEEIRQWLEIYETRGTDAQMQEWVRLADRQLGALEDEKKSLEDTILDLRQLRDEVAKALG